jgi:hypothetical protein
MVKVVVGILALVLGIQALFAFDAFGLDLDDYVPLWLTDLLTLIVMFALIAAVARGAPSKEPRPHSS